MYCSEGMWKCADSKCIDSTKVCDGFAQCTDASDEKECANRTCQTNWRKCRDNHQCIPDEAVCDGDNNCLDRSDENGQFCIDYNCQANSYKCANEWQCIKDIHICDGIAHCFDISDELCDSNCLQKSFGDKVAIILNRKSQKCSKSPRFMVMSLQHDSS